jgi:hypothetical protein
MSAINSVTSSDSITYATQLAEAAKLRRSLNSMGTAIENGDLTSAGSTLSGIMKAFPQYAGSPTDAAQPQDPINQGFQKITTAIANNQVAAAQTAWTQLKSDLKQAGVSDISDGKAATAKLLSDSKASLDQAVLSSFFGSNSDANSTLSALYGATGNSSSATDSASTAIQNWLTYEASGTPATSAATGDKLNATA